MTLGEKITALRKDRNYSQEDLADILKVSRQAISKWENDSAIPDIEKIVILSRLFKCSIDYLLFNKEEETLLEEKKPLKDNFDLSVFNLIKTILFALFPIINLILFANTFVKEHFVSGGMEFIGNSYSFYGLVSFNNNGLNVMSLLTIIITISLILISVFLLFKNKYVKLFVYLVIFAFLVLSIVSLIMIYSLKGYDIYPLTLTIIISPILYLIGFIVSVVVNKAKGVKA